MQPADYARRILLAVSGLSPQILTETLYALAVVGGGFIPTEVHLLTTAEGGERARLTLLSREPGWFHRLCREYGLSGIRFDSQHIHVLTDGDGQPLSDIRTPEENQRAADHITEHVRRLSADPQSALHISIAGGRKSMGFYLGYALSLFGRPQDRLSHVLVPPPFESHPEFFYPSRDSRIIYAQDKSQRPLDTRQARIMLAPIPFVRLRHGLPQALLNGEVSFSAAVGAVNRRLGPLRLELDYAHKRIRAAGGLVGLPPVDLAFYGWLSRRVQATEPPLACPSEGVAERAYAEALLAEYRAIIGELGDDDRVRRALATGMTKEYFLQRRSRINAKLRRSLGIDAEPYLIARDGRRPHSRYQLRLQAEQIAFQENNASMDGSPAASLPTRTVATPRPIMPKRSL